MESFFKSVAVMSGLLLFGTLGFAQEHDRGPVLQKVRYDINHVQSVKSLFSVEVLSLTNRRLEKLEKDYTACQCQGALDQPAFHDLIHTLQRAMLENPIAGREREILQEDLNLLRGTPYSDTQVYNK
jgi:hypothetical protein